MEQVHPSTALMPRYEVNDRRVLTSIMGKAFQHNLTFYYSAYPTIDHKVDLILVTEDGKLAQAARDGDITVDNAETLITSR
jgi:predicted nucleic acid-binding protein